LNSDVDRIRNPFILLSLSILLLIIPLYPQDSTRQKTNLDLDLYTPLNVRYSLQHRDIVNFPITICCLELKSRPDTWYGDDKIRHLVGSMFSAALLVQVADHRTRWPEKEIKIFAAGTTLGLGFVKELYDRRKPGNHFCWKDLTVDAGGVLIGLILSGIK